MKNKILVSIIMNQSITSQRYINKRRVARRVDDEVHPSMMTNYNNLAMSRPELVAMKLLDADNQGGYFSNKKDKSSAIPFNAQMNEIRPGREGDSFERRR